MSLFHLFITTVAEYSLLLNLFQFNLRLIDCKCTTHSSKVEQLVVEDQSGSFSCFKPGYGKVVCYRVRENYHLHTCIVHLHMHVNILCYHVNSWLDRGTGSVGGVFSKSNNVFCMLFNSNSSLCGYTSSFELNYKFEIQMIASYTSILTLEVSIYLAPTLSLCIALRWLESVEWFIQ